MSAGYPWREMSDNPPAPMFHEKEPATKPVLYDHRGKPLVRPDRKVGFERPATRNEHG